MDTQTNNKELASKELTTFINELQEKHNVLVITLPKFEQNNGGLFFSISSYISVVEKPVTKESDTTTPASEVTAAEVK